MSIMLRYLSWIICVGLCHSVNLPLNGMNRVSHWLVEQMNHQSDHDQVRTHRRLLTKHRWCTIQLHRVTVVVMR